MNREDDMQWGENVILQSNVKCEHFIRTTKGGEQFGGWKLMRCRRIDAASLGGRNFWKRHQAIEEN
jgi:hypothetical protein